jgi:hypothetical protein
MTLHVVQYSGGIGSWAATQCVIAEHGTDHLVLLTADTRVEDPDLWRFVRDSTVHVGVEPTIVADGLTPFEVFHDQRFLGNSVSRPAQPSSSNDPAGHDSPCTPTWRTQCCTSASTGRKPAVSRRSNTAGHRGGCGSRCVTPYLSKEDMLDAARAAGLTPPRLYELGFSHNNFSGLRSAQQLRTWSHSAHGYAPGRTRVPMCVQPNLSRSGKPLAATCRIGLPSAAVNPSLVAAVSRHLHPERVDTNGVQYKSSFVALLQDIRGAAERDGDTGQVLAGRRSQSWLAATSYLMLLDQVGTGFKLQGKPVAGTNSFLHALDHFTTLTNVAEREALYALRNAFAHDYALFNVNRNNPLRTHAFELDANAVDPLVVLPQNRWDGDFDNLTPDMATRVNLQAVGDLVEGVVAALRQHHAAGELEVRLPETEFMIRYGIFYRP